MQRGPLSIVEVVSIVGDDAVHELDIYDLAFRQIGGLVENDPPILHMGLEGLHRRESVLRAGPVVEGGASLAFSSDSAARSAKSSAASAPAATSRASAAVVLLVRRRAAAG